VATSDTRVGKGCWLLLVGAIAGSLFQWPDTERLSLIGFGLAGAALPFLEKRIPLRVPALAAAIAFAAVIAAGLGPYRERYPGYGYGPEFRAAWQWVDENLSNVHIAYTGSNLPYPLYGRNLANRVSYANVAMESGTKVHEFPADVPATTPEPVPYRKGAEFERWLANLGSLGCDTLFVSAMFPIVLRNVDHDEDGFPVERAWADGHPEMFRLRYAAGGVRIYDIVGFRAAPGEG
jgi:hypothetical protein